MERCYTRHRDTQCTAGRHLQLASRMASFTSTPATSSPLPCACSLRLAPTPSPTSATVPLHWFPTRLQYPADKLSVQWMNPLHVGSAKTAHNHQFSSSPDGHVRPLKDLVYISQLRQRKGGARKWTKERKEEATVWISPGAAETLKKQGLVFFLDGSRWREEGKLRFSSLVKRERKVRKERAKREGNRK